MAEEKVKENEKLVSRRSFLKGAATVAGLTLVSGAGSTLLSACSPKPAVAEPTAVTWPFPYAKLDPAKVGERAYAAFKTMGCGFGVTEGIIGELAAVVGKPYTDFPTELTACYAGGFGAASLCGSLGGAATAIGVVCDAATQKTVLAELIAWYKKHEFPTYQPAKLSLPVTVSNSELCKDSVGTWMAAAGVTSMTDEKRKERCAGVTAETAMKAVELLNAALVK